MERERDFDRHMFMNRRRRRRSEESEENQIREEDILSWVKFNELKFLNCACKFTEETHEIDDSKSKRKEMKKLIKEQRKQNPNIDYNIFKALDNVNLDCVLGTKKNREYESFLKHYDE